MAINQYKDGKGVNDYRKGNRTDSKRNADIIKQYSANYKNELDAYKEYAEKRRANRTVRQEASGKYLENILNYIQGCKEKEEPMTRAGIMLALGIGRDTYHRLRSGELDYRLDEYICINSIDESKAQLNDMGIPFVMDGKEVVLLIPLSDIIQKAELLLEQEAERRLYTSSRVGDIFALKSLHNWREDSSPSTVNNTLVISSAESAREAIRLLK